MNELGGVGSMTDSDYRARGWCSKEDCERVVAMQKASKHGLPATYRIYPAHEDAALAALKLPSWVHVIEYRRAA